MLIEVSVADVHRAWVVGQGAGIWRQWDGADDCVFRLRIGNADWGSLLDEAEKLRSKVFVHADAAVGAGVVFDPAGMEAVVWFKLTPIRHGSALERPTGGTTAEHRLRHLVAIVCVAMGIGSVGVLLIENLVISSGSRGTRSPHGNGHGKQDFGAFHHIGALFTERDFDPNVFWVGRKLCGAVVSVISREATTAETR